MTELPTDFSPDDYLSLNLDLRLSGVNPTEHYLVHGAAEGRRYKKTRYATKDRRRALHESGLFNAYTYVSRYRKLFGYEMTADEHYLDIGSDLGWWASNFFRTNWYRGRYSQHFTWAYQHPIFHYIHGGYKKGFMPCPFFEPSYYLDKYGDEIGHEEPLKHFLREGHTGRFNPSSRFDAQKYLEEVGDVWPRNPLEHYITNGIHQGILPKRPSAPNVDEKVTAAALRFIKKQLPSKNLVLLVTHSPNGSIKPHTIHYVTKLEQAGLSVCMIIASDVEHVSIPKQVEQSCAIICVRENIGWDFAAWAHILAVMPEIYDSESLILTNDSVAGPIGVDISDLLSRVDEKSSDVTGLVINDDYSDHMQSFFLHFNSKALENTATKHFFSSVINQVDKDLVIVDYEVTLTNYLRANGLVCEPLFDTSQYEGNTTILHWQELLDVGFPFLKIAAIKGADTWVKPKMLKAMRERGYDTSLLSPRYSKFRLMNSARTFFERVTNYLFRQTVS